MPDKNLLSIDDLTQENIEYLLERTKYFRTKMNDEFPCILHNKIIAHLFFQPSTRTRFSFETATLRLGGKIVGFDNPDGTRAGNNWRESLADTAQIFSGFVDGVVIRHPKVSAVQEYAKYSSIPVINAGNGIGVGSEHPSQALLDLFTIFENFETLEGLTILLIGGMQLRTVHSFMMAIRYYPTSKIILFPGKNSSISPNDLEFYNNMKTDFIVVSQIEEYLCQADVIYHHGLSENRDDKIEPSIVLNHDRLNDIKKSAIILHSLPRAEELSKDVDLMPQAKYFHQAKNGVSARMAILEFILGSSSGPHRKV